MQDIYLIRHSKTDANAISSDDPVMCGSTQSHITEEGKKMVRRIALERIKNDRNFEKAINNIDNIVVSSLERTKETVIAMFPNKVCDGENNQGTFYFNPRKAFDEINFGDYEMISKSKLPEEILNLWKYNPSELTFPNGDNIQERANEVYNELLSLINNINKPLIIVSSCTILRLLMTKILNLPLVDFHKIDMPNCNIIHIKYSKKKNKFIVMEE